MEKKMTKADEMFPFSTPTGSMQQGEPKVSNTEMKFGHCNDFELVPDSPKADVEAKGSAQTLNFF